MDGAVRPAAQEWADESRGRAVGLGPVGAGAEVADLESAARDRVDGGTVRRAVVGDQPLDRDPHRAVVRDGTTKESDSGGGLLVGENFDVGQAGCVVDRDVHVLPADGLAANAGGIDSLWGVAQTACAVDDALPSAAVDPSELLDVDVQQLAGTRALVALRGLQPDPAELPDPAPGEDS